MIRNLLVLLATLLGLAAPAGASELRLGPDSFVRTDAAQALAPAAQARARWNAGQMPVLATRRRAGALGDSITADSVGGNLFSNWGYLAWARRILGQRIDLPTSRIYGVAGATIANVVASQLPTAIVDNLDIAFVHAGTNSLGSDTTANLTAQLQSIYDQLRANGTFVVAIPIRVHGASAAITGTNLLQMAAINRWIVEYCRANAGMLLTDVNPIYADFSTGNAKTGLLRDDVHDTQTSALAMGQAVAGPLNSLIPAVDDRFALLGDVYDATNNVRGNLLVNGLLAGSDTAYPAIRNGATGAAASPGWSGLRSGNTGTVAIAFSKESDAVYTGLSKQVMAISGTADGKSGVIWQYVDLTTVTSPPTTGDKVVTEMELEYTINSALTFTGMELRLDAQNGSDPTIASAEDGYAPGSNGNFPAGSGTLVYKTPPLTIPAGTRYLRVQFIVGTGVSGTLDGTFKAKRWSLRKVSALGAAANDNLAPLRMAA